MLDQLTEKVSKYANTSIEVRLQEFAHHFMGTTYGAWQSGSTLESLDDFNYDLAVLDCVTFVEVVLALAKTQPNGDFIDLLRMIHYRDGVPSYMARNHFISLDWIPNNSFLLHDITREMSKNAQLAVATIDKLNWLKVTKNISSLKPQIPQVVELPYITTLDLLDHQMQHFERFPECSIVNIVRPNWDLRAKIGTNLNISHLGLVFKDHIEQILRFYHASETHSKVVCSDLCEYMAGCIDSPTIRGINILGIKPDFYPLTK